MAIKGSPLRYVGGKSKSADWIVSQILANTTSNERNEIVIPFLGGGNVYSNASHLFKFAAINDINPDIANLYSAIKTQPKYLIGEYNHYANAYSGRDGYYHAREMFNSESRGGLQAAALFLYLNRRCFNGLCRYNRNGEFNVPYGDIRKPYNPHKEIESLSAKLNQNSAKIHCMDFVEFIYQSAQNNAVIYADPPYVDEGNGTSAFKFSGFSKAQQEELAEVARDIASSRRMPVFVSNHDTEESRSIYNNADKILAKKVARSISASASGRRKAAELLAIYLP